MPSRRSATGGVEWATVERKHGKKASAPCGRMFSLYRREKGRRLSDAGARLREARVNGVVSLFCKALREDTLSEGRGTSPGQDSRG